MQPSPLDVSPRQLPVFPLDNNDDQQSNEETDLEGEVKRIFFPFSSDVNYLSDTA